MECFCNYSSQDNSFGKDKLSLAKQQTIFYLFEFYIKNAYNLSIKVLLAKTNELSIQ